jgi:tripartite-type tricarboxylate transporter receptor subunit TctC
MRSLISLLILFWVGLADAQTYPARPVRMLVGFPPGGGTDIMARFLAPQLAEYLKQPFVVENRPGATTNIATDMVAKSAPDGYTLLFTTSALAINMSLYKNLTFDALKDFAPISVFAESPNLLVAHQSAGANVRELLAQARAKPDSMNYSSAGAGTSQHLAGELFKARTGTKIAHIPYKGTAASLTAVISGEVQFSFANVPAILGHVRSGRIRALAVLADKRSDLMPDVPTMKEAGVDMVSYNWRGIGGPPNLPKNVVDFWVQTLGKMRETDDWKKGYLAKVNQGDGWLVGDDLMKYVHKEHDQFKAVFEKLGLLKKN